MPPVDHAVPRLTPLEHPAAQNPVEIFERAFATQQRRRALVSITSLIFASALLAWALNIAGFFEPKGANAPFAKIADFLVRMNPDLNAEHLFADKTQKGSFAAWFHRWPQWRTAMIETIEMAFVGTSLGVGFGFIGALLCARTTMPFFSVRWIAKRFFEILRIVPDLILALILVALFGLGPFAGVLTLILSISGAVARYIGEALENTDNAPRAGVRAAGGGWAQDIRFGVFPQIAPLFISYTFLRFEVSVSSATTLGIVGAGGIGEELMRAMLYNQYQDYFAILILIIVVIIATDFASEQVRHRMAKTEGAL